jgi:translation initiation factor 2 alpha subunit (eIF-2alpha)
MANLVENQVVLCTVKRIEKTTVFVEIEGKGEGTIIFAEISPGRIRNIREYVSINKRIVCKVLRIKGDHIELSLRRVSGKEREEVLEEHKKERMLASMVKPILKDKTKETIRKIKEEYIISEFLDEARTDSKILKKYFPKEAIPSVEKLLIEKKEKEKTALKKITLKTRSPKGIKDIKEILDFKDEKTKITYLGSSKFSVSTKANDYKTANHHIDEIISIIKERAKSLNANFQIIDK